MNDDMRKLRITVNYNPPMDKYDIYVVNGGDFVGKPLTMSQVTDELNVPPTFTMDEASLQDLFEKLWKMHFRPRTEPRNAFDQILAEQKDIIEKQQVFIDHLLKEVDALSRPDIVIKGMNR